MTWRGTPASGSRIFFPHRLTRVARSRARILASVAPTRLVAIRAWRPARSLGLTVMRFGVAISRFSYRNPERSFSSEVRGEIAQAQALRDPHPKSSTWAFVAPIPPQRPLNETPELVIPAAANRRSVSIENYRPGPRHKPPPTKQTGPRLLTDRRARARARLRARERSQVRDAP